MYSYAMDDGHAPLGDVATIGDEQANLFLGGVINRIGKGIAGAAGSVVGGIIPGDFGEAKWVTERLTPSTKKGGATVPNAPPTEVAAVPATSQGPAVPPADGGIVRSIVNKVVGNPEVLLVGMLLGIIFIKKFR